MISSPRAFTDCFFLFFLIFISLLSPFFLLNPKGKMKKVRLDAVWLSHPRLSEMRQVLFSRNILKKRKKNIVLPKVFICPTNAKLSYFCPSTPYFTVHLSLSSSVSLLISIFTFLRLSTITFYQANTDYQKLQECFSLHSIYLLW